MLQHYCTQHMQLPINPEPRPAYHECSADPETKRGINEIRTRATRLLQLQSGDRTNMLPRYVQEHKHHFFDFTEMHYVS